MTVPISTVKMHLFDEVINGRAYQIEVLFVGPTTWRAQIVRGHGGPTALMPFYGATPA